jgi:hypothetical protein
VARLRSAVYDDFVSFTSRSGTSTVRPIASRRIQWKLSEEQGDASREHRAQQHCEEHPNDPLNPRKRFRMFASDVRQDAGDFFEGIHVAEYSATIVPP